MEVGPYGTVGGSQAQVGLDRERIFTALYEASVKPRKGAVAQACSALVLMEPKRDELRKSGRRGKSVVGA